MNKIEIEHADNIGKCFKAIDKGYRGVDAFEIINVSSAPYENYATCMCVITSSCCDSGCCKGVGEFPIPLWSYAESRIKNSENDSLVIDLYQEITKEEFDDIFYNGFYNIQK